MTHAHLAEHILKDGLIGRGVFHKSDWKKIKKGRSACLFRQSKDPLNFSVHRLDIRPHKETAAVGYDAAKQRQAQGEKCGFYGWAELSVQGISQGGRKVYDLQDSWWHAEIVLPPEAEDPEEWNGHISALVIAAASYRYHLSPESHKIECRCAICQAPPTAAA